MDPYSKAHASQGESGAMASMMAILRSGYYIATLLPLLLWIPVSMRLHLRRAAKTFEHELLSGGLNPSVAHQLTTAFNYAQKDLISQLTSPRNWAHAKQVRHDDA